MSTGVIANPAPSADGARAGEGVPRYDFPTWLPPMFVKELRQGLRTRGFVGSLVGFQAVMVFAFIWAFAVNVFGDNGGFRTANSLFWSVLGVMLLAVTPLRAMAGLRHEIDAKTLDLLVLTNLTAWRIVMGKWTSLLAQAALLGMALLPYGVMRYFFGSVDLLEDLGLLALMYLGCAVLTGVGLWMSGLPRLVRFGVPIALFVFGAQFNINRIARMFDFGLGAAIPGNEKGWAIGWLVFHAVLLLLFCLVQAVRRIAPPAEIHSGFARALGWAAFAPIPVLYLAFGQQQALWQLLIAVGALIVVTVVEISNLRTPMAVHVRGWWRRGRLGSCLGALSLPGWQSAGLYCGLWASVGAVLIYVFAPTHMKLAAPTYAWLFALLWAGLVFPSVLVSTLPNVGRQAPLAYFIVQACFGILAILIGNGSVSARPSMVRVFGEWLAHVLPVSSFWIRAVEVGNHPAENLYFAEQAVMVVGVLLFAVARSVPYWKRVSDFGRTAVAVKGGATDAR